MKTKIIVQSLYYLAAKNSGEMDKLAAIKLIFFADRYHLRKYARMVTRDDYFAMKHGPVPSMTFDVLNGVLSSERNEFEEVTAQYLKPIRKHYFGITEKDKSLDCLSETDIESLNFAFDNFFSKNEWKVVEYSHQYPEWKRFEKVFDQGETARANIFLEDFFENPEIDNDPYTKTVSAEVVQLSKESFFDE